MQLHGRAAWLVGTPHPFVPTGISRHGVLLPFLTAPTLYVLQRNAKTERQTKKEQNFPQRKFALKA